MIIAQFDFNIENCTKEKAEELLALIIDFSEKNDLVMAGGFHVEIEEEDNDGEEA